MNGTRKIQTDRTGQDRKKDFRVFLGGVYSPKPKGRNRNRSAGDVNVGRTWKFGVVPIIDYVGFGMECCEA